MRVVLPRLLPWQNEVRRSPARFKVVSGGRRVGKSRLAGALCIEAALSGQSAMWVSPTYPMAESRWQELKRLSDPLPDMKRREDLKIIEFPGGGLVRVFSAHDPASLRGDSWALAVLDECAFIAKLKDVWDGAIRPALSERRGKALLISSPNGRNAFWEFWVMGQGNDPEWQSWRVPTSANPAIEESEIEAMRRALPDRRFRSEVLAEFLDDGAGVFRGVHGLARAAVQAAAIEGHRYALGIDIGRSNDFTAIVCIDDTLSPPEVCHVDRFTGLPFAAQIGRIQAIVERFRPGSVVVEANNAGQAVIEQMQSAGIPNLRSITTTNATKQAQVEALMLAFERESLLIPPDENLIAELLAFGAETLPSGLTRYAAQSGHDDLVMSLLLAYQASLSSASTFCEIW